MVAIDTNVLVRIVVNDDPVQCEKALSVLAGEVVHIPVTVILESEWVFRHCYGLGTAKTCLTFGELLKTEGVEIAEAAAVERAVALHEQGMDFADALHLCLASETADTFCTFDKALANSVPEALPVAVRKL